MSVLVTRIEWMEKYDGTDDEWSRVGKYAQSGETVAEAWNFRVASDGFVYGYVKIPRDGKLNSKRFLSGDPEGENPLVVFTAKPTPSDPWVVVGWYHAPEVGEEKYRYPDAVSFFKLKAKKVGFTFRVRPENASLLSTKDRNFHYQYHSTSQIRYLEGAAGDSLREYILAFETGANGLVNPKSVSLGVEGRAAKLARRMERSGSAGRWIAHIACPKCEACGLAHTLENHPSMRARFEVHHKNEMRLLRDGEKRKLISDDLAVLCANCHRAIHRTDFAADIASFRKRVLKLND